MKSSFEKRRFCRVRLVNVSIEYSIIGKKTKSMVEIINLSEGGLCFLGDTILQTGERLLINISYKSINIILKALVERVVGREVAVRFLENHEKIENLINAISIKTSRLYAEFLKAYQNDLC